MTPRQHHARLARAAATTAAITRVAAPQIVIRHRFVGCCRGCGGAVPLAGSFTREELAAGAHPAREGTCTRCGAAWRADTDSPLAPRDARDAGGTEGTDA